MLTLKRNDETGGAAIDFDNKRQEIIRILGSIANGAQQFSVLDKIGGTTIFAVSKKLRQIYDYKTGTLKEIVVNDDLKFKQGDVWNVPGDIPFAGYLTNGSNRIYFTVPLPRNCQGRTVTLSGKLTVRSMEGYLINLINISEFSISTEIYENLLRFIVEKSDKSKFSESNNIPVAVSLNENPQITFS